MLLPVLFASLAHADDKPVVLVVGAHLPGVLGEAADAVSAKLEGALEDRGTVDALTPLEVSKRIRGRESLVLETYALGPGRERLKEAQVLYDRAQVEEAGPVAEDAVGLLQRGMAVSTNTRALLDAEVLLGMIRIALGDEKGAYSAFRKAAVLDVTRELDAVNYPPHVIELYDGARGELAKKSPATVSITTSVGATVYVDGKEIGAAPVDSLTLVPGEHCVLVRAAGGAASFESVVVTAGEKRAVDVALETEGLGTAADDNPARSRQIKDLYRAFGEYDEGGAVLIAGQLPTGQVGVQLYSPTSGNFSRALTVDPGDDPVGALVDLVPTVAGYLADTGDIRADRVGAQVLPLDVGTNPVLAGLLLDPPPLQDPNANPTVVVKKGVPWWVWAGTGAVVAGAGATVAVVLTQQPGTGPGEDPDQGTIVFGPVP